MLLAGLAIMTAACGLTGSGAGRPLPEPSPTPSANDVVGAATLTRGLGTAHVEVDVLTRLGDREDSLHGSGGIALHKGYGDLVWTDPSGARTRELSNSRGLFVQRDVPGGMWTRLPASDATATGPLAAPLRGLGALVSTVKDGIEPVGDVSATRMTGSVPASTDELALLGFGSAQVAELAGSASGRSVDVTVWIDPRGRVVRVDRELDMLDADGEPVVARVSTVLSDFMTGLDLTAPPDDRVIDASSSP